MASETEFSTMLQRMIQEGEGLSRFLPVMLAIAGDFVDSDDEDSMDIDSEIRRVVMIGSGLGFEEGEKQGKSPALKSAVENMPRVVIGEDEKEEGGSCPICLDEWSQGDVAAEMPCKHKFHSKCVEEWLGKHATCPLCRYEMPVEEKQEEEGESVGVVISFSIGF